MRQLTSHRTQAVALAIVVALVAACGAEPGPSFAGQPGSTPTATATATAKTTAGPLGSAQSGPWRTDRRVGSALGDVAFNTLVTLRDGSTATLAEMAAGKPLMLYFFAMW